MWSGYEELHGLGSYWVFVTVKVASRSGKHTRGKHLLVIIPICNTAFVLFQKRIMTKEQKEREGACNHHTKIKIWKHSHGSPVTIFSSHVYCFIDQLQC